MWLLADYAATGLFSLKHSLATSSGGKTLLLPTPYALKMALLDVAYRSLGAERAEACWPGIRDLQVACWPPEFVTVTNLFTRILKPSRAKPDPTEPIRGPFDRTIGYREFVHFSEPLRLAVAPHEEAFGETLAALLAGINYLGKRGCFVQLLAPPRAVETLPEGYLRLNAPSGQTEFDARGTLQMLDDCGPKMTAAQANAFCKDEKVRLDKERLLHPIVLPYRVLRASTSYTLYQRLT